MDRCDTACFVVFGTGMGLSVACLDVRVRLQGRVRVVGVFRVFSRWVRGGGIGWRVFGEEREFWESEGG